MTSPTIESHPHGVYDAYPADPKEGTWCFQRLVGRLNPSRSRKDTNRIFPNTPQTTQERRDASLNDHAFDTTALTSANISAAEEKGKTVLYLAYGSNLCNETFRDKRGIKPLSQINVLIPTLRLTFDLPGIPYIEPCFANSAIRDPDSDVPSDSGDDDNGKPDYHKDRWHKGMVGCVYEVTPSDYAHIIATEGGGASYTDILVDCYPLLPADMVPSTPTTTPFKAHTLFAPATPERSRPDPSYAQPSARYLKLITDGATELNLPTEYQEYLNDIRTYTITTKRQQVGKGIFMAVWMPLLLLLMELGSRFQDGKGRVPEWLGMLLGWIFKGIWISYDAVFKKAFGDGERTEGLDEESEGLMQSWRRRRGEVDGLSGDASVLA